jgi:hypothetical protein
MAKIKEKYVTFKEFHSGNIYEVEEDKNTLKALHRQITSYLRESTKERLHGIYNKIYILKKQFENDTNFEQSLTEDVKDTVKVNLIRFILNEGFDIKNSKTETKLIWKYQLDQIKENYNK